MYMQSCRSFPTSLIFCNSGFSCNRYVDHVDILCIKVCNHRNSKWNVPATQHISVTERSLSFSNNSAKPKNVGFHPVDICAVICVKFNFNNIHSEKHLSSERLKKNYVLWIKFILKRWQVIYLITIIYIYAGYILCWNEIH